MVATRRHADARSDTRPLRVDVVTDTYPPEINGVAMTMGRLVRGLRDRGHLITVIRARQQAEIDGAEHALEHATDPGEIVRPSIGMPRYPGVRVALPCGRIFGDRWRADPPDVVHLVTEGPMGFAALRVARRLGIPVTSGFHTHFHEFVKHYRFTAISGAVLSWLRHFHNATEATIVPSVDQARRLRNGGFENVHVVARGVDLELYAPERRSEDLRTSWGARPQDVVMANVGRIAPEKNLDLALRAARRVRALRPDARFVVVGDGPALARLAGQPDVVCTGVKVGESLATHYASADVFLFPSLTETFGNVLCEAMASGLAPVAFDYAAAAMHVVEGESGLKAPFGDERAWIDAAVRMAADDELRRRCALHARAAMADIGWSRVVDTLETLLLGVRARGVTT